MVDAQETLFGLRLVAEHTQIGVVDRHAREIGARDEHSAFVEQVEDDLFADHHRRGIVAQREHAVAVEQVALRQLDLDRLLLVEHVPGLLAE